MHKHLDLVTCYPMAELHFIFLCAIQRCVKREKQTFCLVTYIYIYLLFK